MKKFATATVAALSIAATLALSAAPAEAKFGRRGAFIGGVAAALIGGALVAGAARAHHAPVYSECWTEKRPRYNRLGRFPRLPLHPGLQLIRICKESNARPKGPAHSQRPLQNSRALGRKSVYRFFAEYRCSILRNRSAFGRLNGIIQSSAHLTEGLLRCGHIATLMFQAGLFSGNWYPNSVSISIVLRTASRAIMRS